jgi:hypothetical protein
MHGGNIQECSYSYKKWLGLGLGYQKCTNRARNGGVCYDHYIESLLEPEAGKQGNRGFRF